MKLAIVAILSFAFGTVFAQSLMIGQPAPKISVKKWVANAPTGPIAGKVTILEFWATWCAPCVGAFPHLNSLQADAKRLGINFISITDESEALVTKFLKTHPLQTAVAIDEDGKTFRAFNAEMIPTTVVIDANGDVVAVTLPEKITAEVLKVLAEGKDPGIAKAAEKEPDIAWDRDGKTIPDSTVSQVLVRKSVATSGMDYLNPKNGRIAGDGIDLMRLIRLAYGAEESPVSGSLTQPAERYQVSVKPADNKLDTGRALLKNIVDLSFPFEAKWQDRIFDVIVLRKGKNFNLKTSDVKQSSGFARPGKMEGKGVDMGWLARMLGLRASEVRGVDETGIKGAFDFRIEWAIGDISSLQKALEQIGLTITVEKRPVPVLLVSDRK